MQIDSQKFVDDLAIGCDGINRFAEELRLILTSAFETVNQDIAQLAERQTEIHKQEKVEKKKED